MRRSERCLVLDASSSTSPKRGSISGSKGDGWGPRSGSLWRPSVMPLPDCSFVAHVDVAERTHACRSPRRSCFVPARMRTIPRRASAAVLCVREAQRVRQTPCGSTRSGGIGVMPESRREESGGMPRSPALIRVCPLPRGSNPRAWPRSGLSLASLQGFAQYDRDWQHRKVTPPTTTSSAIRRDAASLCVCRLTGTSSSHRRRAISRVMSNVRSDWPELHFMWITSYPAWLKPVFCSFMEWPPRDCQSAGAR